MIALAVGLWFSTMPSVVAKDAPIRVVPQDIEITVFSEAETDRETLYQPVQTLQPVANPAAQSWQMQQAELQVTRQVAARAFGRRGPFKTGMALVKDHRLILNLKSGDNVVRFTDVAARIEPTTVRFESLTDPQGTRVLEQNYQFDLVSQQKLIERYLDREITVEQVQEITRIATRHGFRLGGFRSFEREVTEEHIARVRERAWATGGAV